MNYEDALDYCISKCSLEVQLIHPENHINWFSANKLETMIEKAGFGTVYRFGYWQSRCVALRDTELLEARDPQFRPVFRGAEGPSRGKRGKMSSK